MKMSPEDKMKKDNVMGLFKNPSTRPIVFFTGAILLGMVGLGVMKWGDADQDVDSSANVGRIATAEHRPGVNSSAEHNRLQQEANRRALEQAQREGRSSLPSLTGDSSVNDPLVLPDQAPVQPDVQLPQVPELPQEPIVEQPVTPVVPVPEPIVQQPIEAPVQVAQGSDAMNDQILGYLNLWGPKANVHQEFVYAGTATPEDIAAISQRAQASQQGTNGQGLNNNQAPQKPESQIRFVRAGTMIPAVLITPLNSDAPGPVIAQITSGPLEGARLIGNMRVSKESILVEFMQISKPGWPDTYGVSAIGMDLKSSTALATDVNHHHLKRYLGMLTGSYMEGYGRGLEQMDRRTIVTDGGNLIQDSNALSTEEIRNQAEGSVLSTIGSDIAQRADQQTTTIKVEGKAGQPYPIKILFMSNF